MTSTIGIPSEILGVACLCLPGLSIVGRPPLRPRDVQPGPGAFLDEVTLDYVDGFAHASPARRCVPHGEGRAGRCRIQEWLTAPTFSAAGRAVEPTLLQVQRPDGLAVPHVPGGQEPPAPVKALRTFVLGVHRKPNSLDVRPVLDNVCDKQFQCRRPNALPLLRDVNGQVKQFRVLACVSKGNDSNHRGSRGDRERLPIEVVRPDVRLREYDQGDGLMTSDVRELIRGYLYG